MVVTDKRAEQPSMNDVIELNELRPRKVIKEKVAVLSVLKNLSVLTIRDRSRPTASVNTGLSSLCLSVVPYTINSYYSYRPVSIVYSLRTSRAGLFQ